MTAGPQDRQDATLAVEMEAQEVMPVRDVPIHRPEERQSTSERSLKSEDATEDATEDGYLKEFIPAAYSHWDPEPGFAHIDGDISGRGYNDTTVDVIAVPCIGASPVDTWARDPLSEGYFGFPVATELDKYSTVKELPGSSLLSPTIDRVLPKASHTWIRQGIRKEVNTARVMLYRHRELTEGMTLEQAADDLLGQLAKMRAGLTKSRPIFFVCHSIGGLVVKSAMVKASQKEELKPLVFDCHGMAFFGTPHRGSSYLSMPNLRESIQHLLYLQSPLPRSITDELRLGYKPLLRLHEQFMDIASELRIWTFYEMIDSQLSGLGTSDFDEVHFSAPITSIKSCLIGTRAEQALSLESDHAHCASFGPLNIRMMHSFLADLGQAVRKAESLSANFIHTPLRLPSKVKLELIGFYEDPDSETSQDLRLYVTRHYLDEFLDKGPESCLRERLNTVAAEPRRGTLPPSRRLTTNPSRMSGALGIMQEFGQRFLGSARPDDSSKGPGQETADAGSPEIVVTSHARRPSVAGAATEPLPNTTPRRSPGLTVPSLSTPGFGRPSSRSSSVGTDSEGTGRTLSEPLGTDISPKEGGRAPQIGPANSHDVMPGIDERDHISERKSRRDRMSRASALQDLTAGFSRPDPTKRRFMWIHLPFNNPHWVKSIFGKLSETQNRSYSKLLSNDYWASKHVQGRHSNLHGSIVTRRMKHGRARPVPKDISQLESLECRVIWEFIGHDPPLHTRRTLDEYGYPSLRDTYARDDDQMLYKLTKERLTMQSNRKRDMYHPGGESFSAVSPASRFRSIADTLLKSDAASRADDTEPELEDDIIDGKVLMVDQLWLWAVDATTLMTFFPKRESQPTEGPLFQQADLRNSVYNELNGDLTGRCNNAYDLAAFITLHAVTVLLDRSSHPDLEIFRIFEEALGILTEKMTSSLKRFRMQTYRDNIPSESDSDEGDDNKSSTIKKRHKRELQRAERQNRENTSALLELRDMEDELSTLKILFSEQQATIEVMKMNYEKPELQTNTECGRAFLKEALKRLKEYQKQAHDMIERVDTTRKDYEKLQEMIQRQAQVDEVRWSRLQTELASSQNLSVMIFTTFTVIFLPLSFFTSLFGMNTQEWGGPDENNFVSLGVIGAIALPASAFLVGTALIAAFSSRIQAVFKAIFRIYRSGVTHLTHELSKLKPKASKESKERRKEMKAMREQRRQRKRERGYDFWETLRADRRPEYEIPDMNRKGATKRRLAGRGTWRKMVKDGY
ncbi:Uu.00g006670.m01.CDS01 [Anthostomella pinea]|uniref:Uu.00g006670.m01.CDS01 n=1 Tax=Anthostomella pinea TaxID=933095 RepID=A0AAI8VL23_9PEZI|nr:Uu.00g006670.m01.CDS01 [Anthostomella pinea]